MKKNLFTLLLSSCLILALFSCTPKLRIETLRPPKVPVTNDQWQVVAINGFNPGLLPQDDQKVVEVMTLGAREAFQGAVDAILDDSTFLLVHADTAAYPVTGKDDKLSKEQLQEIALRHPHHLLLTLHHFEVYMEIYEGGTLGESGYSAPIPQIRLFTQARWVLYDENGKELDDIAIEANDFMQSGMSFLGAVPSINKAAPSIYYLAWYAGYDYWARLYPQPDTYQRPYYNNKKLREAATSMVYEDWETAITQLEPIARSNERVAAKAAYNLAVVYEAMSKFEEAKYWALQAAKKNNSNALLLLHELENY